MNDIEKHVLQKRVDEQRDYDKAKEIAPKLLEQCRSEEMTMRQVELTISIMQTVIKDYYSCMPLNVLMNSSDNEDK